MTLLHTVSAKQALGERAQVRRALAFARLLSSLADDDQRAGK